VNSIYYGYVQVGTMMPSEDRTNPENHEYINRQKQSIHEFDMNTDPPDESPFWYPDEGDLTDTAWRYMDLAKFISILQTGSLWFSHHSNFEDPYDGRYSEITAEEIRSDYDELGLDISDTADGDRTFGTENYVSCWNIKEEQSVALWKMYFEGDVGVAIKTTKEDLISSVPPELGLAHKFSLVSGEVVYRKVDDEPRGYYGPIFSKRPIFDFENEFRMVYSTFNSQLSNNGISVPVNVESLIDEVYVHPMSGSYVKGIVEDLGDKYDFDFDVKKSSLFTHPHDEDE